MSEYTISQVYPTDKTVLAQIDTLLSQEGCAAASAIEVVTLGKALFQHRQTDIQHCGKSSFHLPAHTSDTVLNIKLLAGRYYARHIIFLRHRTGQSSGRRPPPHNAGAAPCCSLCCPQSR